MSIATRGSEAMQKAARPPRNFRNVWMVMFVLLESGFTDVVVERFAGPRTISSLRGRVKSCRALVRGKVHRGGEMSDPVVLHRLQFAFTITYHYLFPQLTMGLALLIVVMKALGLRRGGERWNDAARFWIRIFGDQLRRGRRDRHPDGVPVRHQLGRLLALRRAASSARRSAMEGMFAFFLESTLPRRCWSAASGGSVRGGHFLAARRPVRSAAGCRATSSSRPTPSCSTRSATRSAPTAPCGSPTSGRSCSTRGRSPQYAHNMIAAVVTASFVVAAVGAFYAPRRAAPRARRAVPARSA